jgi:hydrophobe/amphiphile efflux-3 (HAE3) family protein
VDAAFRFITGRPWLTLLVLGAVTLLALAQVVDPRSGEILLEIDPSENRLLPEKSEAKAFYDFARRAFGSDETMVIALHADDIFTERNLECVTRLTDRLEEIDGVHHVVSLTKAIDIRGTEGTLEIRPFVTDVPSTHEELQAIRTAVLENPIYAGNLVSKDGRTTALIVHFLNFSDREFIDRGIDRQIEQIVEEEKGDAQAWISGGPHVKVAFARYSAADLRRNLPLIVGVLAAVLALCFRTTRGVLMPLATVVMALVWTLGIAAWIDRPLNLVTMLIPALMLILGMSYAVHVVSGYYDVLRGEPQQTSGRAAAGALKLVALPIALTALTTIAGFLALALNPVGAVSEFGQLALVGVAASTLAALTLTPALLAALGRPRRLGPLSEGTSSDLFGRAAKLLADFALQHSRAILIGFGALFVAAALSATQLEVGGDNIKSFPEDAPVRTDFEAVNRHLEGANAFNIVVHGEPEGTFQKPENLRVLEEFQDWLEAQSEIGGTTSLVDYLKLINRGFHENDPAHLAIPESERFTAQLLFFGSNEELEGFVDASRRWTNINVRANVLDRQQVSALVRRIEARMAEFPEGLQGTVTGNPILKNNLVDTIARGQAYSMVTALLLIYGILVVFFLSWSTGFAALLPNALIIAVYFGTLGATGVELGPATSVIGPMALGIAVDDTIHYFARFTEDAKRFADERRATLTTLLAVGRPVTYTSLAICSGFLVLTTSDIGGQIQVGALGAFTLAFAWAVDLTLTPALCTGLRVVTLWDTLRLDLGDQPQTTIGMFEGLRMWQCRVVALMASLRPVPAGQRLMYSGEQGRELYVILDGELEISIDTEEGRRVLNTCRRGEVIGEVGFFHHDATRSANVDVTEDARLLRLTEKNMRRLSRRYPQTAARVFRNLGEVLAERLTTSTERLA